MAAEINNRIFGHVIGRGGYSTYNTGMPGFNGRRRRSRRRYAAVMPAADITADTTDITADSDLITADNNSDE